MAKPTVFIGSSVEQKELAEAIQSSLQYDVKPIIWTQGTFEPSRYVLESLEKALDLADFAILVCAPDDITTVRGEQLRTVRDNVIFELGLFIGRLGRARVFLVSPRDTKLHMPSDLMGIFPETFDPLQLSNAEAALGPACSKIKNAMRDLGPLARPELEAGPESGDDKSERAEVSPPMSQETTNWGPRDYERAFAISLFRNDPQEAAHLDTLFRASGLGETPEAAAIWEAWREVAALMARRGGDLKLVRAQVEAFPLNPRLREILAIGLDHYGDVTGAIESYLQAARNTDEMKFAANVAVRALELGENSSTLSVASDFRTLLADLKQSTHADKTAFIEAMRSISKAAQLPEVSRAITEVGLTLAPEDLNTRFELAHSYGESQLNDIAMLHYESIPEPERSGMTWNNLGASYSRLSLSGKAVYCFEVAVQKGETIAQGNLAQKLLQAGFFDDAQKRLEKAVSVEEHHESVVDVLASIQEARKTQQSTYETARAKAKELQAALVTIGQAALKMVGQDIVGSWDTPYGTVELREEDGKYVGIGETIREVTQSEFATLFGGPRRTVEKSRTRVTLSRLGNALEGTATRDGAETALSLLGSIVSKRELLLRVSDDGCTIIGFEVGYQNKPFIWTRLPALPST